MTRKFGLTTSYCLGAILIYSLSCLGKLTSDFSLPVMDRYDPFLVFLSYRTLLLVGASLELAVILLAIRTLVGGRPFLSMQICYCMALLILLYRIGWYLAPAGGTKCHCFGEGSLFSKTSFGNYSDQLAILCLVYLVGAGTVLMSLHCFRGRFRASLFRFICSSVVVGIYFFGSQRAQAVGVEYHAYEFRGTLTKCFIGGTNQVAHKIAEMSFLWYQDSEDKWYCELEQVFAPPPKIDRVSVICGSENGNVFTIYLNGHVYHSALLDPVAWSKVGALGYVDPENLQPVSDSYTYPIWFAFLGGKYLDGAVAKKQPSLFAGSMNNPSDLVCDTVMSLLQEDSSLIKEATWTPNPVYMTFPGLVNDLHANPPVHTAEANSLRDSLNLQRQIASWRKTDSHYKLEEIGQVNGAIFPKKFSAELFSYYLPNSIAARIDVEVTNAIECQPRRSVLPLLPGFATINDNRFRVNKDGYFRGPITYMITNHEWILDETNSRLKKIAARWPMLPIAHSGYVSYGKYPRFVLALFLVCGVSLTWLVVQAFRRRAVILGSGSNSEGDGR